MNCSAWRRLMQRFRDDARLDDRERRGLVEHFTGCSSCRHEGLAVDPTLLFLGASPLEFERSEVTSIRQTVQSMRRARELELAGLRPRGRVGRAAAAVILLSALFLLPGGGEKRLEAPSRARDGEPRSGDPLHSVPEDLARISVWDSPSIIENLDRPNARIYQLTEKDLSVVMIVDETLDL